MFGKRGNKSGMGGSDVDWEAEQFQKGGGVTYGDKDEGPFNDAATGISVSFLLGCFLFLIGLVWFVWFVCLLFGCCLLQ